MEIRQNCVTCDPNITLFDKEIKQCFYLRLLDNLFVPHYYMTVTDLHFFGAVDHQKLSLDKFSLQNKKCYYVNFYFMVQGCLVSKWTYLSCIQRAMSIVIGWERNLWTVIG